MTKKKIKWHHPKAIISIVAGATLIGLFIYSYLNNNSENELLDKYGKYETAVITKKNTTYRAKKYVHYEFVVNNKTYKGQRLYYSSYGPVEVGYKFQVRYYPEDPTINKLLYDKRIKEKPKWVEELKKEYDTNN